MKRKPVKTYLVVLRTNLDELPICITADRRYARKRASSISDEEASKSAKVMGVDHAGRVVSAIITFTNGEPTKLDLVKDWDDEEEKQAA